MQRVAHYQTEPRDNPSFVHGVAQYDTELIIFNICDVKEQIKIFL